jgi:hypothetical protein
MALTYNWIDQVTAKLACATNDLTPFELRKYKVGIELETLLEVNPAALDVVADGLNPGFSLSTLLGLIQCSSFVPEIDLMRAEAMIAAQVLALKEIAPLSVYGAGTAYTLTATPAAVDLAGVGSVDPVLVLNKAGTYRISARVQIRFAGATFAASQEVAIKLRRTNNTAGDLTGGSTAIPSGITSVLTGLLAVVNLPDVIYTTANDDDSITIFASVAVLPGVGTVTVTEASIVAERIGI